MTELDDSPESTPDTSSLNSISSILAAAVMRRISLPKFISASGSAQAIKIDEIRLGNASVDRVDVEELNTEVDTGTIKLEDARAIVSLSLSFHYGIHIPLPWPFDDISIDGNIPIPDPPDFPFDIGQIDIPALNNIDLEIPTATLEDIQASVQPVNNLDLGGATFNNIKLDNTVLPTAGFGMSGLSMGALNLNDVSVPSVSSERLSLGDFAPDNPLVLPSISIKDIDLPEASVPRVESDGPVVVPGVTSSTQKIGLTGGLLEASIDITPTLTIRIGSMVINDISAISTIKKVDLRDIQTTVQVDGVAVEGVELNSVELESIATTV